MPRRSRVHAAAALIAGLLAACSGAPPSGPPQAPNTPDTPSSADPTPLSGEVTAQLRQSSHDAARERMQVWIQNDTEEDLVPTRIVFRDRRLGAPVRGERLRRIPSGSERGYPLALSRDPDCTAASREPSLVVHEAGRRLDVPVEDPNDLVARHTASRCLENAVTAIADLHWDDEVVRNGEGPDTTAGLVLVVEPTGERGSFTIEEVNGTPVLAPLGSASWKPGVTVSAAEGRQRVELPMIPARCDPHAFAESGGATAFRIHVRVGSESGSFVLRMSDEGARHALAFALETCGL